MMLMQLNTAVALSFVVGVNRIYGVTQLLVTVDSRRVCCRYEWQLSWVGNLTSHLRHQRDSTLLLATVTDCCRQLSCIGVIGVNWPYCMPNSPFSSDLLSVCFGIAKPSLVFH